MKPLVLFVLFVAAGNVTTLAQMKTRLHVVITEDGEKKVTPAMVCITNVHTGKVYLPPYGEPAGEPTFPQDFYEGFTFADKNHIGPLRKMSGQGEVNGQRTYVYNPNPSLPYWSEPLMYQTPGDFSIDLPPGLWRIAVEHGNEYVPYSKQLLIRPGGRSKSLAVMLKRWINLPARGWWSGDVHTHHPLQKPVFRQYMQEFARAEDLHLVNVLEMGDRSRTYFTPEGYGTGFQRCFGGYCLVTGQEEPRSTFGHIIGLNPDSLARDTAQYDHYDIVLKKIHRKSQALAGFAHFAYGGEGVKEGMAIYAPTGNIEFVELLQNTKLNAGMYYQYLNLGFRITAAAGSDFPWGSTIGDGRTFVYAGTSLTPDHWFAAMKAGHTFVSNGPALLLSGNGQLPGSTIVCSKDDTVTIEVKVFSNPKIGVISTVELRNNDGLLQQRFNIPQKDSFSIRLRHAVGKSQWITAAAYCLNGALAHTSPLYIVVNGQPTFSIEKAPGIISDQLRILQQVRLTQAARENPDAGIIKRVDDARQWYLHLLTQVEKLAGSPR